jgi:hypothetical protein
MSGDCCVVTLRPCVQSVSIIISKFSRIKQKFTIYLILSSTPFPPPRQRIVVNYLCHVMFLGQGSFMSAKRLLAHLYFLILTPNEICCRITINLVTNCEICK